MTVRKLRSVLAIAALFFSALAPAQDWPTRTVRIIVPVAPGAAPDSIARLLSDWLARSLGRPFVVENVTGAGGMAAAQAASRAAPDGYGYLLAGVGVVATDRLLFKSLPYDPDRDFVPVAILYDSAPFAISVHPSLPVTTIRELIDLAKAQPGKLSYGMLNVGVQVIPGLWLNKVAGIEMLAVPYKAAGQLLQDAMAGRIQISTASVGGMDVHHRSGKLRVIAVTSPKRLPILPDVPAVAETLPGFRVSGIGILMAPSGAPSEVIQRLNREIGVIARNPEYLQRFHAYGVTTVDGAGTPQQIAEFLRSERENWTTMLKGVNFQPL